MKKLLSLILLFSLLMPSVAGAYVEEDHEGHNHSEEEEIIEELLKGPQGGSDTEPVTDPDLAEVVEESSLLIQLKQKLAQAQHRYYVLQNNVESAKEGLIEIGESINTLEGAIAHLDALLADTNKKIRSVKEQIEQKKMDIATTEEEIQRLEAQLEEQKIVVGELLTLIYVKRGVYYDQNEVNTIKVLASTNSVSETLQKLTYLDLIEEENQNQIQKLDELSDELSLKWEELRTRESELGKLDEELQGELKNLEAERQGKENLLTETKGDEAIYQNMLQAASEREEDILKEIKIFEQNVLTMEGKLKQNRATLSEDQRAIIESIEAEAIQSFSVEEASGTLELDWPVSPERGLTAFFHDSGYRAVFGVDHYATDIRANQGSPIYAPADGVVYNVVFDPKSTSYAYIMIAHRMGVMTLYGHVSEPGVKAGDYVTRGQIIGLTGATPGTVGSGYRTTGPHLHFEVWQDGVRVDPLKYLPLEQVPMDSLPQEYLEQIQKKLEEQIRAVQGAMSQ